MEGVGGDGSVAIVVNGEKNAEFVVRLPKPYPQA
jgi:hypothetical protein